MAHEKDPELRAILLGQTDAAIRVIRMDRKGESWWIPRSQIGYLRKEEEPDGSLRVIFTLPEWLIEKKQLWELVP